MTKKMKSMKSLLNYLKPYFLVLIGGGWGGCSEFLDVQSNAALEIPKELESLQKLLDDSRIMNSNIPSYGEISADNYYLSDATYSAFPEDSKRIYIWDRQDYFYTNDWAQGYMPAYSANLALETLNKIGFLGQYEKEMSDNVYGSALFYRAFQFLGLTWTFSKAYDNRTASEELGIVLKKTTDQSAPSVRASLEETYDAIISDLKESIEFLPNYPSHVMRPSKGAAYSVLARTYLSMAIYDSAQFYVEKALELHPELMDFNDDPNLAPQL